MYVCVCPRARIKNTFYIFWTRQPACSIKYLVIRRKVCPTCLFTRRVMSGVTSPPTCPPPVHPHFLVAARHPDIAPLIEYTYANFPPADVANCNLLLPRCCNTNLVLLGKKFYPVSSPDAREVFSSRVLLLFTLARSSLRRKKSPAKIRRRKNRKDGVAEKKPPTFTSARTLRAFPQNDERLPRERGKKKVR